MAAIDIALLLKEVSIDAPCGENLEYDAAFQELERISEYGEERYSAGVVIPPEEPNWREVKKLAINIFKQTKDVRVAIALLKALVGIHAWSGLSSGLQLLLGLLENYWEDVHPVMDEGDPYPIERINALAELNQFNGFLKKIHETPLTESVMGRYSLRDIELAEGKIKEPDYEGDLPTTKIVSAAFQDTDKETIAAIGKDIAEARTTFNALRSFVTDKVSSSNAPDLVALSNLLDNLHRAISPYLPQAPIEQIHNDENIESGGGSDQNRFSASSDDGDVQMPEAMQIVKQQGIHSREDVDRAIDEVCAYFEQYEPTSPAPLMLKRVQRMLSMDFMEILEEIAPGGIAEAEGVCGKSNDDG